MPVVPVRGTCKLMGRRWPDEIRREVVICGYIGGRRLNKGKRVVKIHTKMALPHVVILYCAFSGALI